MTSPVVFEKAERIQRHFKLGLQGPSGSGKTLGALSLARQLSPDGRIAVLDTEAGSASLYADRYDFDRLNLAPPYLSAKYEACIKAAHGAGYEVLVIDSLSHQWAGEGGILSRKEEHDARGGNSFTNWAKFTPEQEKFKATIVNAPIHIIATLRTKQDYVLEATAAGRQAPKKVGMAAIQREGMEYEFDVNFEIQMDHKAIASKDRTGLFSNTEMVDLLSGDVGRRLLEWHGSGKAAPVPPPVVWASTEQIRDLLALAHQVGGRSAQTVTDGIEKGVTAAKAAEWITKLTAKAAEKNQ